MKALKEMLDREKAAGRIKATNSPYGSPTFLVDKKDGKYQMVVDYRRLNQVTIPDAYPLPLINQVLTCLGESTIYSKFDIITAYQGLRVAEEDEQYTAFRTPFGSFISRVMRDGLRNAPAAYQHLVHEVLGELIRFGVIVYIDDIIIHAKSVEELRDLTHRVFNKLRAAQMYLKAAKCEFEKTEVMFLGFKVLNTGIGANPGYVQGIIDYPSPRNLKECRRFVGMASYYRRFVKDFSRIAHPLHHLTKNDVPWRWTEVEQKAFKTLKSSMSTAPVLAHFDPAAETIVQTDASHYGWGFVISQIDPSTKEEHPVAIESGSFKGAELNYTTTEKEFLAIVNAFKRKRHLLLQVSSTILTDHLDLTYWMEARQLNPRQGRWVEIMTGFKYMIVYRPGVKAMYPDALSRRPDYSNGKDDHNLIQALPSFDNGSTVNSTLGVVLRAVVPTGSEDADTEKEESHEVMNLEDLVKGLTADDELELVRTELAAHEQGSVLQPAPTRLLGFLHCMGFDESTSIIHDNQGLIRLNGRIYVPDAQSLRRQILKSRHDSILAGHQGVSKTLELISRDYCWLGLRRDVETYVPGCAICQRTKSVRQRPHGSLEVAERPWSSISMDFVEELPKSNGFNSILVVVDRLSKWAIFILTTTKLSTVGLIDLVIDHVVSQHGLPSSIISDRGSKFTSHLWAGINKALGIRVALSTAFHPQTDGQTERVNQVLEQCLRVFVSYKQDKWSRLLPRAAFSYNNSIHSAMKMSPFYANYGYNPRWVDEFHIESNTSTPTIEKVGNMVELHELCKSNIELANQDYAKIYNTKHLDQPEIKVGDSVLVSLQNVTTRRPSKKLDIRFAGPYRVLVAVGTRAFRVDLPQSMKNHPVFHVPLLKRFNEPTYPGQDYTPPGPVKVDQTTEDESFEVSAVVDSRIKRNRLEYLVEWSGYEGTAEHASWEPASNLEGSQESVDEFHRLNGDKPSQEDLTRR